MPMSNNENNVMPDLENLKSYKDRKLFIAAQLRIIREGFSVLGLTEAEKDCGELMVKLAEDRFTLAVIGQFKRGKSSLMNAIIGKELLPTGVLPLTSAITILKYGPVEKLQVNYQHLQFPEDQPISALADFVTETGNPDNQKKVKSVYIEMPVPFLRYGVEFVDTPGIGSAIKANTATTYNFLPECDAVVFVTAVDTPMTSLELELLKAVSGYAAKLFFVINKIDLITEKEKSEVATFVLKTISNITGEEPRRLYEISSRQALEGRANGNKELYQASGLQQLEDDLGNFLSEQKATAFLAAVTRKMLKMVGEQANSGAFNEASLQARIKFLKEQTVKTVYREPHQAVQLMLQARQKLTALYPLDKEEYILLPEIATAMSPSDTNAPAAVVQEEPAKLDADMHTRSCPVCRHVAEQLSDFYAHWQYELSSKESAQEQFALEIGFCPLHSWQLLSMASPYGASIGFSGLSETLAGRLKRAAHKTNETVWELVKDSRSCRVCKLVANWETGVIHALAERLKMPDGKSNYLDSQGACLRHLAMLLDAVPKDETDWLIAHAAERFGQDAEDMRTYAMKQEALRRGLQNKNEEDAYRRMMIRLVGDRSVCIPWTHN